MTIKEAADRIEAFANGTAGPWDWDDFISIRQKDPEVEAVRQKCVAIADEFPPTEPRKYCSDAGMQALRDLAADLHGRLQGAR